MARTIVIVGTLDTKAEEIGFIRDFIEKKGHKALIVDGGVTGTIPFSPDVSREEVAEAAGKTLAEIVALGNEGKAIATMAEGAAKIVHALYDTGSADAVISIGGSMGTSLGLAAMKHLPVGFPKLMVSTIAFTPLVTVDAMAMDQVMMQSPVDLWGLNVVTRRILESAAAAIVGMAEVSEKIVVKRPLVAITTRGIMKYVNWIKPMLEERGYEVVVIHAVGMVGGKTLETVARHRMLCSVLDLCTGEIIEELNGGALRAGPDRLEAAGQMGIPQIVAPGSMEFWHWPGPVDTVPKDRKLHVHNPLVLGVKATTEEMIRAAKAVAEKLNHAKGPVTFLFPLLGFDAHDQPGGTFYDPEGRAKFLEALKAAAGPNIKLVELDMHINDKAFAEYVVSEFDKISVTPSCQTQ
ncbi:MAG: hypothetical protein A4E62_02233 [Syntrophorhabdus sp. PtaU1.Bin002]|nr:MAG: hypothetical protein A4E62_02233 [Syntrophorhabdus sp. PtaU1.Bin002]